jgi:hypothetical protein
MVHSTRMRSVRRRLAFLFHYFLARAKSKSINRLLPIIEKSFSHSWVTRVELNVRFWPGGETTLHRLWRSFKSLPKKDFMHWDAPVTISVFRRRRGKERQALCMSLYIRSGILYIAQLQGVPRTDMPAELRPWPKMLIEACKKFASEERLKEVRVAKANTLISYLNPYGSALTEARKMAVPRIRRDMELIYDKNALELGLVPDGNWFKWQNERPIRDSQLTLMQRATPAAASCTLMAATTAILFQLHADQAGPHRLVYFYLLPLVLIALLYTDRVAVICAGMALLCADYFLQDPVFSFYSSEYGDLIGFAVLAAFTIKSTRYVFSRNNGDTASSR